MHSDAADLVLGLDTGGTSSRALVADVTGRVLGTGRAGGGNPNSHPPESAVAQIGTAVRHALGALPAERVRRGVLGMAGISKMTDPTVADLFERTWSELGLTVPMRVISDSEVAFAAGTASPDGSVLIAGTGAIATRIERHRAVATFGGHGWLLGDEGSAFWLGREAVRETLRVLDHRAVREDLVNAVLAALVPESDTEDTERLRNELISTVNAAAPIRLAELAPLVTTAAAAGEDAAGCIVHRAASLLADTAEPTRTTSDTTPIVLAGGLVGAGNPLGDALRGELTTRFPVEPRTAGPGTAGAAWLAATELLGHRDPELHERYLTGARSAGQ
ncbi:N-acetylglucosamine kinase [Parasphingorhabdus pacifica]